MCHCLLCLVPWGLILPVSPLLPEPTLAFQLTCSRWAAQWGGHWHRQMCLFTGDKTLCCCRWQCPGASGALWHYCHTTAISALQGELLFFKHSTSWFVCGFRAWWYKPCHQIFFFPCGLSYLFYSNLWIARISSPYLFKLRVGFLEAINYVVDKNLKVKLATSSC